MPLLSIEYFSRKMVLELPLVLLRIRSFIFLISGLSPPLLSPPFCPYCQLGFAEKGVSGCCCQQHVFLPPSCRVGRSKDGLLSLQWSVCPFCCLEDAAGEVDRCSPWLLSSRGSAPCRCCQKLQELNELSSSCLAAAGCCRRRGGEEKLLSS